MRGKVWKVIEVSMAQGVVTLYARNLLLGGVALFRTTGVNASPRIT